MSKCKAHPHPRWFTPELRHQLNKLHTLRRKHKKLKLKNKLQSDSSSASLEAESRFNNLSSTANSYTNQSWSVTMPITQTKKFLTTFDQFADRPLLHIQFSLMTVFQLMIMTRPTCSTNSFSLCLNQVIFHHLTPVLYQLLILFWTTSLSLRLMCTLPAPT